MTFDEFQLKALDVPFVIGGREYDGWDCWGLIYCAYRDVLQKPVQSYAAEYDPRLVYAEIAEMIEVEREEWLPVVGAVRFGDVALFRVGRFHSHVGLVVSATQFLHALEGVGTNIVRLNYIYWAQRNVGYFRRA